MCNFVFFQTSGFCTAKLTQMTFEWFHTCVSQFMSFEMLFLCRHCSYIHHMCKACLQYELTHVLQVPDAPLSCSCTVHIRKAYRPCVSMREIWGTHLLKNWQYISHTGKASFQDYLISYLTSGDDNFYHTFFTCKAFCVCDFFINEKIAVNKDYC